MMETLFTIENVGDIAQLLRIKKGHSRIRFARVGESGDWAIVFGVGEDNVDDGPKVRNIDHNEKVLSIFGVVLNDSTTAHILAKRFENLAELMKAQEEGKA